MPSGRLRSERFASKSVAHRVPWPGLVAVLLWGVSFPAVRVALEGLSPLVLTTGRFAVAAAFLAWVQVGRGGIRLPSRADRPRCLLLGTLLGAHLGIQAWGLEHTSAVHTGWIVAFMPVAIALGSWAVLGKGPNAVSWFGIALATGGVLWITSDSLPGFAESCFGDRLQLSTCATWALYSLLGIEVVRRNGALVVTTCTTAVAALVCGLAAARGPVRLELSLPTVGAFLYLALLCSGVAFVLWYRSQERYGPHRTAATLYFEPFATMAAATLLLQEPWGARTLAGGALVLVGVVLVDRSNTSR